jgi:imidazolonepropionase-like amidohydrolase
MADAPNEARMMIVFSDARVFDGVCAEVGDPRHVVVEDGRIREVTASRPQLSGATVVPCGRRFLMPGLIDAHFHACSPSWDVRASDRMPPSLMAFHAGRILADTLDRGFTTVRDAAGADFGLARALELGLIRGPRLRYAGRALSQSGGHGDMRAIDETPLCDCHGYAGLLARTVDGVEDMRRAVREELRRGAHQIKLFVSGGVLSPADPIWMPQFSDEEIRVAVEEARTRRVYVMAHCHTDAGAARCAALGVRSIEHGTLIESDETARSIAAAEAMVVPTLSVGDALSQPNGARKISPAMLQKRRSLGDAALRAIEVCRRNGVKLGLGTDLFDYESHPRQGGELELRARVDKPIDVLRSATSINAELLQLQGEIGVIAAGAHADLLVLDFDPLEDLSQFRHKARMPVVMKAGEFVRNEL